MDSLLYARLKNGRAVLGILSVPGRPTGMDYSNARACCLDMFL